ncbi:Panacea domain-containing protein [Candidatus Poriferisocius sp.]|uniref:Panacea domain-containing protein n=1 Tax=Candidatus Poriferisocius sp. TaxID=3101276 RepID=UPI003B0135CA
MANVNDVAAYVLSKQGKMSTMKLQKLLYYCQAWHLVWDEEPLFDADFQAWANGPVVYEIYDQHRGCFSVDEWESGDPHNVPQQAAGIIDDVLADYGSLAGHQLSRLTHSEDPWRDARGDLGASERSGQTIGKERIRDYYTALSANDEATLVSEINWN